MVSKFEGKLEFDGVRTTENKDETGNKQNVVLSRTGEIRILDPETNRQYVSQHIPYGATLHVKDGQAIKKGRPDL